MFGEMISATMSLYHHDQSIFRGNVNEGIVDDRHQTRGNNI